MYTFYILQCTSSGRYFVGHSSDFLKRYNEHLCGQHKETRDRGPWVVVHTRTFESRQEAMRKEKEVKSWNSNRKIRRYLSSKKKKEAVEA